MTAGGSRGAKGLCEGSRARLQHPVPIQAAKQAEGHSRELPPRFAGAPRAKGAQHDSEVAPLTRLAKQVLRRGAREGVTTDEHEPR
jgi:hypothetical protein